MADSGSSTKTLGVFVGGALLGVAVAAGTVYTINTMNKHMKTPTLRSRSSRELNPERSMSALPSPHKPQIDRERSVRGQQRSTSPAPMQSMSNLQLQPMQSLPSRSASPIMGESDVNRRRSQAVLQAAKPVPQPKEYSAPTKKPSTPRQVLYTSKVADVTTDDENLVSLDLTTRGKSVSRMNFPEPVPLARPESSDNVKAASQVQLTQLTAESGSAKPFYAAPMDRMLFNGMDLLRSTTLHVQRRGNSTGPPEAEKLAETGKAIELAAQHDDYSRVVTPEMALKEEEEEVCANLLECMEMRKKWLFQPVAQVGSEQCAREPDAAVPSAVNPHPMEYRRVEASNHHFEMVNGVMQVWSDETYAQPLFGCPGSATDFFSDMHKILRYAALGPVKSLCHHRLMLLEQKFNLHVMLNADKEFLAQKSAPHRDFYNVRKVDTHIHHSACMHQKHLLRFIKSKLRKEPDEVVIFRDGKYLTLREVFQSLNLTGYDLNVDTLDMHADKNIFHRFDKFNLKYNPCGQSRLREIFIKQDNLIHGRFLAELTQELFNDLEASKYQHTELRISIYGRKQVEWDILAQWVVGNNLYSDNNVWLVQVPRLYNVYKDTGIIDNFQEMLDNIFSPLFEVTKDPDTHPQLHVFLSQCVGFDMVDDESKPERRPTKHSAAPQFWNSKHNAAYAYYAYYMYANLYILNKFREARGMNTFTFRPHAGEAGDVDHLVSAFLLCENIAHGINLRKSPCLQYLYYLAQIGLCMSPLSNNSLFLDYHRNPFPSFFARGLSVSLSTDDPLQIHLTKEPLVEEYSVAAQVWKLSSTDLCEIARNGVLHSGFPNSCKKHWVSETFWLPGPDGNDIHKTNVPNLRMRFRYDTFVDETRLVLHGGLAHTTRQQMKMLSLKE